MKYVKKLCLINRLSKNQNNKKIIEFISFSIIISLLISISTLRYFSMWYIFVFCFFTSMFCILYLGNMYISIMLNKIYNLFPMAVQLFTDEYVTCKNIKLALDNSYNKMPTQISRAFESLARRFASETNYEVIIKDFADGLDFTWGYAFAEILQLSYEGAGDISEDLIFLNKLSSDQIKGDLETETALSGTKMIFLILNACTLVGFLANVMFMPNAKELYFYTQTGNFGLVFWGLSFMIGLAVLSILKHI